MKQAGLRQLPANHYFQAHGLREIWAGLLEPSFDLNFTVYVMLKVLETFLQS